METQTSIRAYIRSRFASPLYRPPVLPESALRIQQLAARGMPSVDEVVCVIERDPLLAGRVFAVARSHFYSRSQAPSNLRQAVMRLGIYTLRDIAMEISVNDAIFDRPVFADALRALGRHSRATAHAVPCVVKASGVRFVDAFIAGLFHDIGAAGALLCIADRAQDGEVCNADTVLMAIDDIHGALGMEMVTCWDLPAELRTVVWRHHDVELHGMAMADAACVCLAEEMVNRLGWSFPLVDPLSADDPTLDAVAPDVLELGRRTLGLDEARLDDLTEEIEGRLERMDAPTA